MLAALNAPFPWTRRHVLSLEDFSAAEYALVLQTAGSFQQVLARRNRKVPTLQGRIIVNLFFESSTRTRTSFELAAKALSADVVNFSAATSSLTKGETIFDTTRTFLAMGMDIVVVRHRDSGVPHAVARDLEQLGSPVSVINAGDGQHEHPTQALLDLFTLCTLLDAYDPRPELLAGKKIVIVGDILHSRVARSNLCSLVTCGGEVHLAGPPTLLPGEFRQYGATLHHHLAPALEGADFVMTLRLQKERMGDYLLPSLREYHRLYGITRERLALCSPGVRLLHPGPVNRGVELSSDLLDDPRLSLVSQQVTSGVAVRMALLYLLAGGKAA
ncbi:aspartate carbamoyltransferase catalytic subunit [Gloeobacter violaceus]|uniref:Aspartate carbamoyltransferase catalytic subunit n=1 Tax=Gloeobacter violaceus (strain ATCC 29082 / PCC 7421) TaxID=251221 RepID=PYRB_GLOVI|nr:RecName: Full=Aspartate carbamoyltransferase catalytic subunit; AltName: Full=Aspartate transcarbamylase; Short=ATCase [Gloeobacter violaceus PCC 7421]BAC90816.1 aspartate carbamoyltransferase [Gloeobacter violaceus PCC 7421]